MHWLKHAFAVDAGPAGPTPEQSAVIDRLCREIVRRRLSPPALAFLEMSRPLNYLGAQALHFLAPLLSAITDDAGHRHFAGFLEHRGAVDLLCRRIEELEQSAADELPTNPR